MSMTDPLADMLTRIRNGQMASLRSIESPASKLRKNVLSVLKDEGYIVDFEDVTGADGHPAVKIHLKYVEGEPVIKVIKKLSKPGRRQYSQAQSIEKFYNGLGVVIMSTPKGVISDYQARKLNVGGEVLCCVF